MLETFLPMVVVVLHPTHRCLDPTTSPAYFQHSLYATKKVDIDKNQKV